MDAQAMSAYMKGLFPFLGIKKPLRTALTKPLFERANLPSKVELQATCEALCGPCPSANTKWSLGPHPQI